jgi:hypothetical protein
MCRIRYAALRIFWGLLVTEQIIPVSPMAG